MRPQCKEFAPTRLDSFRPEDDITVMRRLMLLRHAKTERAAPGESDRDRKLMTRGRTDALAVGAYMAHHGLVPDGAMVSPAARAQETWALVAGALVTPPRMVSDERIYNASPQALAAVIAEAPKADTLLVVGHNPGLHELAGQLIGSGDVEMRDQLKESLPTSGLLVIDLPIDDWSGIRPQAGRLDRFVSPRLIAVATE
jgi:phosphohistidine phosphatase